MSGSSESSGNGFQRTSAPGLKQLAGNQSTNSSVSGNLDLFFRRLDYRLPALSIDKTAALCELDRCSIAELAQAVQESIAQGDGETAEGLD